MPGSIIKFSLVIPASKAALTLSCISEITSLTTDNPSLAINTSSANNVSIGGAEHETSEAYLTGVIDNVMVYSVALNDLEIKNIYNSVVKLLSPFTEDYVPASTLVTDNLELHLDALNSSSYSGSGTTWSDLSGESNNGTITNSSEVVYNSNGWFDWTDGPGFDSIGGYVSLPNTAITLGGTYEENELMKAEALIMTGQIDAGVKAIDAVRAYQGAGLPAIAAGLSQTDAYEQLRRERRIALAFRGLSFYDARRWDIIAPDKSRTGVTVVSVTGAVSTNATIVYGFLDYWDVPDNELAYNPAEAGSAPTTNPKK